MAGSQENGGKAVRSRFFYGWAVVGAGMLLMTANSATLNSFGVFFKPLAADFGWSRAATSGVQSLVLISFFLFAIPGGWLADRFGGAKVLALCGCLVGSGLMLTSRVTALWQIYVTYSLMAGIGLCTIFSITGTATAQWFVQRRGLALGLVSSGVGLGSLVGVPIIAGLVDTLGWSRTYFIMGIAVFIVMMVGALVLRRRPPQTDSEAPGRAAHPAKERIGHSSHAMRSVDTGGADFLAAIRTRTLWIMSGIFFFFSFSSQMVSVHLVNYATDLGVAPLVAATLISGIGLSSLSGRILMGAASDRIGNLNILIAGTIGVATSLIWLIFARELWMLYLFAIAFGFAHGSEVPQQTALIGKFFGLRMVLVGVVHSGASLGGAIGAWVGGQVFDVTHSYQGAFLIGVVGIASALIGTILLKRRK